MVWIDNLISDYYKWLKDNAIILSDNKTGWVLISTPFIGMFNDNIEIYAKKDNHKIKLSDNGDTIHNLKLLGVNPSNSNTRKDIVDSILRNYGIMNSGEEIWVECDEKSFTKKKHNLLTAIMELNNLSVLSKHNVSSMFKEDVRKYLDELNINYTAEFISRGTTGLEFTFDFQIAKKHEEIVIKSFNSLNKTNLPVFLFAWHDIKPVRERNSKKTVKAIAIINDESKEVKSEFIDALESKGAGFILWSDRAANDNKNKLIYDEVA